LSVQTIERADGHLPANVAVILGSRKSAPRNDLGNSPPVPLRAMMLYGAFEARRCGRPRTPEHAAQGRKIVELVIGLVTYAIIWSVVIFGSEYVNKNVQ
jgi:hypothetical protein